MSDPLSVAGTAVGITSLGIQVCQSLVKYLRAIRGRKEDIAEGVREVDRVVALLSSLNRLLPRVGSVNGTVQLRECLKNCHTELKKIQTLLAELEGEQQSNKAMQRAANAMRSITYPFQQEKLTAFRQSLRSVLDDLNLIICVVTLDSDATIQETIDTMSQDLKTHVSAQATDLSDLKSKIDFNSVQLRSLKSTISGTLDNITEQLHRTQFSIQDFDQRVDGRLTIIESGTQSIEANSQLTVAKLEEITRVLVSQSAYMENMGVQMKGLQSLPIADFALAGQNTNPEDHFSKTLHEQSTDTMLYRGCHCASSIPKSKSFFNFWNMRFELEQQEHHLPSCKLWRTKKGIKRTAKAMFPLKLACLSARMTVACFEYASGTSRPGLSIKLRNIVKRENCPVHKLVYSSANEIRQGVTIEQFVRWIELLEREVLTLYTNGHASPGDMDEFGFIHAEMIFQSLITYTRVELRPSEILQDTRVTYTFVSFVRTILQAYNGDKGLFSFSRDLAIFRPKSDPFQHETINTKHLLSFMSEEDCFSFTDRVIEQITIQEPSASLKRMIQEAPELSPIVKAILSRRFEDLVLCVTQDSKSVLETIFGLNVLFLSAAWPTGLKYLITTEASTIIDDVCDVFKQTAVIRAIELDQTHSADILLQAGCCLDTDKFDSWLGLWPSYRMATVMANHLAERRARLLETAQQQLGLFSEHASVAFADSAAVELCVALDALGVPLHSSLRVQSGYRSIYSQYPIPLLAFKYFWEKGFRYFEGHDHTGFMPILTHQYRWDVLLESLSMEQMVETVYWLAEKGFMQEKVKDPLGIGLNVCATSYHYLGAFFAHYGTRHMYESNLVEEIPRILDVPMMSQADEDDCVCWCNAEDHGCSPTKLFLITHLQDALWWELSVTRHLLLHQSLGDTISHSIKETLRLLTFEALEMTHTCCSFDTIHEHCPLDLIPEQKWSDKGIFYHDSVSVSRIRSSAEEQSTAALLEELMVEFTEKLSRVTAGVWAFEMFIFTYWRQRISQLYAPDTNAVEDLLQHQVFQGIGLSHPVRTRVFPETLERLLGNDFLLADHLDGSPSLGELTSEIAEYERPYCEWCDRDDKLQ